MMININCKSYERGGWCKDKRIKRSLFGIGARCCVLLDDHFSSKCPHQKKYPRPPAPPAPMASRQKEYYAKILIIQK